jgi:ABC-type transport system involved in multi-copper enzyme maturation permease subunit
VLSGIFILVLAAHVVGLEYQYGAIRVLLARGVGRLHLLSGKIVALTLVGFALLLVESLSPLLNRLSDFIAPPWRSNARYRRASATYFNAAPLSPRERGWG